MIWSDEPLRTSKMIAVAAVLRRHGTLAQTQIAEHIRDDSGKRLLLSNLYTVLRKLRDLEHVSVESRSGGRSQPSKFYTLTPQGLVMAHRDLQAWGGVLGLLKPSNRPWR